MAVERKLHAKNCAVDANGPVARAENARRVYPIDQYELETKLVPRSKFLDYHILQVPLLGQRGYRKADGKFVDDWCGRTSASTLYNWFQLLEDGPPKDRYITHWDADNSTYRLNLRAPSKLRMFHATAETQVSDADLGSYGGFVEAWKEHLKKVYEIGHIYPSSADTRQRAEVAATLTDAKIEDQFAPVLASLRLNNPVFFYSGFTKGRNHLILFVGYAHLAGAGGEPELWLAIADPATPFGWVTPGTLLDLTNGKSTLADLAPAHDVILLVKGDWDDRRGTLVLVRARFFFRRKGDYPAFVKAAKDPQSAYWKQKNYDDFNQKNALFLDDVGNKDKEGGYIFWSKDTANVVVPEGAVVTTQARASFPFEIKGVAAAPIPMLHHQESRPVDLGGFYPLGAHDNLHGGVHLSTKDAVVGKSGFVPVRAMAPGRIVAARFAEKTTPGAAPAEDEKGHRHDLAVELSGNTPNFVLVRHEIESVPKKPGEAPKRWVFHALYMHLAGPGGSLGLKGWQQGLEQSAYRETPWLAALHREQRGALTVIDPDAPALGTHHWPKTEPATEVRTEAVEVIDPTSYEVSNVQTKLGKSAPRDGRVRLVKKPPETDLEAALRALRDGTMTTFAAPHPNLFVTAGTNIGWTSTYVDKGHEGFLHWELFSRPGKDGLEGLAEAAKELLSGGEVFPLFEEKNANNYLDAGEDEDLRKRLPAEDRTEGKEVTWGDLSELSFAGADDKKGIEPSPPLKPEHYYLRIDVSNFQDKVAAGPRTLTLTFRGGEGQGGHGEESTVEITVGAGETQKTVQAPGWASTVEITTPGLMVRGRSKAPEAADVSAHLTRIAKHRFRNLRLRHLNAWSEKETKKELEAHFVKDDKLAALVEAVCFWGDPEHPVYSGDKLSAADLRDAPKLDNIHPIVGLWVVNLLLERGLVRFVSPSADKASSVEPIAKAWLPAVEERPVRAAGTEIAAMAISNQWRMTDVEAKLEAVSGNIRVPIAQSRYQDGNLAGHVALSAWGEFDLVLSHKEGSSWSEKGAKTLGAPKVTLLEPKLAPHQAEPVPLKGGASLGISNSTTTAPRRSPVISWPRPRSRARVRTTRSSIWSIPSSRSRRRQAAPS
ncbi:hypothetical protein A7982_12105 [Minicystis rosea]|nr:hypothetical protein A7982_12105 [Minicystis rosea]